MSKETETSESENLNEIPYHTRLVGLTNDDLRSLAPDATHQHYKGGLYKQCTEIIVEKGGVNSIVVVEHVFPHDRKKFYISAREFSESVNESTEPRYRTLLHNTDINRLQKVRCNVCWWSGLPEKINSNCKACGGSGELTHEQVFGV